MELKVSMDTRRTQPLLAPHDVESISSVSLLLWHPAVDVVYKAVVDTLIGEMAAQTSRN